MLFACSLILVNSAVADCANPKNPIERENCLPGNPPGDWQVEGGGDPTIQGFATDISANIGDTIAFKIKTDARNYNIEIFRIGYYSGLGVDKIASFAPSVQLPQSQPACIFDNTTQLVDCGNWAVSASWTVPATAVSGVYVAHLIRQDTGGGEPYLVRCSRRRTSFRLAL